MGATRFYPGARKTFRFSLASLSTSTKGVIATANRSAFTLSQSLTTPFAVPLLVSMAVTFVTVWFIPKSKFESKLFEFFGCFIFSDLFFLRTASQFDAFNYWDWV
jgi:hypothetical protein